MAYTYINVWRDGAPVVAYEIPDHTLIGEPWAPPHRYKPDAAGRPGEPYPVTWSRFFRVVRDFQADPNVELSESFTAWERGWPVPPVQP